MNIEELQSICIKFPAVTEDIKWTDHLVFSINRKMFLMLTLDQYPVAASFKVSDQDFDKLASLEGFKPAPYLARAKWIFIDDISRLSLEEWEYFANKAYNQVTAKLPKKSLPY